MAELRQSQYLIGTRQTDGSATALTLTGSYQTSNPVRIESNYQVVLDVAYTMGTAETGNSLEVKVEFANPVLPGTAPADILATDWYQQASEATTTGVTTIQLQNYTFTAVSAAATYDRFQIAIPVGSKYMRVSVKETGIASNGGSATVKATITEDHN